MRSMKSRFHEWCRRVQWTAWEFGRGIEIDQDGGVEGSGFLFRIEPPRWLRAWARRYIPPPTEEEMRFARQDISDVLLESLITRNTLMPGVMVGDFFGSTYSISWAEEHL